MPWAFYDQCLSILLLTRRRTTVPVLRDQQRKDVFLHILIMEITVSKQYSKSISVKSIHTGIVNQEIVQGYNLQRQLIVRYLVVWVAVVRPGYTRNKTFPLCASQSTFCFVRPIFGRKSGHVRTPPSQDKLEEASNRRPFLWFPFQRRLGVDVCCDA